jgi:ADP-ribosylglycohydrolase
MRHSVLALTVILLSALACEALAASGPTVLLNEAEFRDRVYACWLGKNIGGTLGMPFEGKQQPQSISFYTNLKEGEPAANDDLDLQMLWLKAMQEHDGRVDARILGEYWLRFVPVDWNEYGVGKRNMRTGLLPPVSGAFDNERWKNSNGAWIRSEIWACLAPGCPAMAARMAREDACVDHGQAEGTLAEIFTASIESAAFIEHDRDKLIEIGLSMIPESSDLAVAIRAGLAAKQAGKNWQEARDAVIQASRRTGWFQAPRNVAFTILGWLYSDGDFGKGICIAVNCGDDTDCTGATLGSIFGIIHGTKGIPAAWSAPIGKAIKVVAIRGFDHPKDLDVLTDQTVAMTKKVQAKYGLPVGLTDGPADLRRVKDLRLSDPNTARRLWALSPWQVVWTEPDVQVTLDYGGDPVISSSVARTAKLMIRNLAGARATLQVALADLPQRWQVTGVPATVPSLAQGASKSVEFSLTAKEPESKPHQMFVEVTGGRNPIRIPFTLIGQSAP